MVLLTEIYNTEHSKVKFFELRLPSSISLNGVKRRCSPPESAGIFSHPGNFSRGLSCEGTPGSLESLKLCSKARLNSLDCVTLNRRSTQSALAQETLHEQTEDLSAMLKRTALVLLAVVMAVVLVIAGVRHMQASEPYIKEVLAQEGNADRGEAIFKMNCAVCHGLEATGEVGPTLRGVSDHKTKVNLIKQVISGKTPPMPQFQPNAQDMADLLEYLEKL